MWPPAKIITMSAAPMASGAITPAPAPITVQPTVRTRNKVPMNSAMYLFISLLWEVFASSVLAANANQRHAFFCAIAVVAALVSSAEPNKQALDTSASTTANGGSRGSRPDQLCSLRLLPWLAEAMGEGGCRFFA